MDGTYRYNVQWDKFYGEKIYYRRISCLFTHSCAFHIFLLYVIFICVYFLCVCAGKTCSCIRKHFVKKGKIIEDKLAYTKFFRLSIIYEKLEKIGNFDDVYIVEKGKEIELVSFKDGFIRKIDILFLNEMVNQVCREDCLDFTTLDDEVELILKEKDLTEYIK